MKCNSLEATWSTKVVSQDVITELVVRNCTSPPSRQSGRCWPEKEQVALGDWRL